MQLRKIGMCEVMMDKEMEDGFNIGMINVLTRSTGIVPRHENWKIKNYGVSVVTV